MIFCISVWLMSGLNNSTTSSFWWHSDAPLLILFSMGGLWVELNHIYIYMPDEMNPKSPPALLTISVLKCQQSGYIARLVLWGRTTWNKCFYHENNTKAHPHESLKRVRIWTPWEFNGITSPYFVWCCPGNTGHSTAECGPRRWAGECRCLSRLSTPGSSSSPAQRRK